MAVKEHMEVKHAERTKEPITNAVMPLYREYNPKHRAYVKRPALMTDEELQNKHHRSVYYVILIKCYRYSNLCGSNLVFGK